ncbi:MAG: cytochrome P460 family protein [Fimbriimonadaceae bacterium]|nr:cytochrome P460 family protein [Fimbriimonadaceae bacterium]
MKIQTQTLIPAALAIVAVTIAGWGWPERGKSTTSAQKEPELLAAVREYQQWTVANKEPKVMARAIDLLCRMPTPEELKKAEQDPHYQKFIKVFVNSIGEKAMFNTLEMPPGTRISGAAFPVGSIIVKEKRIGKEGEIELFTVMRKREKGYNPECGDWEFATVDPKMAKLTSQGKIELCMSCHQEQSKFDYTFRTYFDKK